MWTGSRAPPHKHEMGSKLLGGMFKEEEAYSRLEGKSEKEGHESAQFWSSLGQRSTSRSSGSIGPASQSVRMFRLSSLMGAFKVTEVLSPARLSGVPNVLNFSQQDLYEAEQPSKSYDQ